MSNCELSNEELAERVKNGSQDAELILWTNTQNLVYKLARQYVRAHELDADICEQIKRTIRLLSDEARHNLKIKEYLTEKIDIVEKERIRPARVTDRDFDEDAIKIYRALYLDGDTRPTSRQIGDKFAYGKRAVFSKRDYAISSLAVLIAGFYGIEWQSMSKLVSDDFIVKNVVDN